MLFNENFLGEALFLTELSGRILNTFCLREVSATEKEPGTHHGQNCQPLCLTKQQIRSERVRCFQSNAGVYKLYVFIYLFIIRKSFMNKKWYE